MCANKARIIRIVKAREILIMIVGGLGLWLANVPLMLAAVFAMGVHSTFFGPIKYAILPQHLHKDEVLGGTASSKREPTLPSLGVRSPPARSPQVRSRSDRMYSLLRASD